MNTHIHDISGTVSSKTLKIMLAEDDLDDCTFFKEALEELPVNCELKIVHNGEDLLNTLNQSSGDTDIVFLDLNMPRRNGVEALREMKSTENLKSISVVIMSTSCASNTIEKLYEIGACHFIQKPAEFASLKEVLHSAIMSVTQTNLCSRDRQNFVLSPMGITQ